MINNRIIELSVTYKAHQKLKGALRQFSKTIRQLKEDQANLYALAKNQLKTMGQHMQDYAKKMLDEVGKQVELEVTALG